MGEAAEVNAAGERVWFTTPEAVEYTRCSPSTIKRAIASGALKPDSPSRPGFRIHRFRRATLDAWLTGESANGETE
jgi:excisionase family DNA binding protein